MKRFFATLLFLCGFVGPALAAGYSDWAAIIVAGDNRAHSGKEAEIFDNARRDLAVQFQKLGFQPQNMRTFSVHPEKYPGQNAMHSDSGTIANTLWELANNTKGGCLVYFTSHGSPDGILVTDETVPPEKLTAIINNACGSRPTVALIAACYSGIFLDQSFRFDLARPGAAATKTFGFGGETVGDSRRTGGQWSPAHRRL